MFWAHGPNLDQENYEAPWIKELNTTFIYLAAVLNPINFLKNDILAMNDVAFFQSFFAQHFFRINKFNIEESNQMFEIILNNRSFHFLQKLLKG